MKTIYSKKCTCGNLLEIQAEKTTDERGLNTSNFKYIGFINVDFFQYALCSCYKVYNLNRAINKFHRTK